MRALLVTVALMLVASPALACPQCALNARAGLGSWFILAGMILFPFFVVGGVLFTLKKLALVGDSQ